MNLIRLITPSNLLEEKEKFFSSNSYSPTFKYTWVNSDIEKWLSHRPRYQKLVNALMSQNTDAISKEAKLVFSTEINNEVLENAKEVLRKKPKLLSTPPLEHVEQEFNNAFNYFSIGYQIQIVDEYGFNVRPNYSKHRADLSRGAHYDLFSVAGDIRHELVHIIRRENSKFNTIPPSENYLPTEEGIATYFQDYTGKEENYSLFQHAAEYAITEIGLQSGLREMVDTLYEWGFEKELAWQRATRHKFGFVDTSKPGDIMKPSMYFYHAQKIKMLTNSEKLRLLVGKISLDDLNHYPRYHGLIPENKIRSFYDLLIVRILPLPTTEG
jgi:hypothetical protein